MARSVCSLKSYAAGAAVLFLLAFLSPTLVRSAEDADKAASLRELSVQLIDVGAEQLRRGAYSAAQRSLEQANENRQYLSDSQRKNLDEMLAKTQAAAGEREKIYETMRSADASAKVKNYSRAISSLSSIQESPYLAKAERTQVQTNLAAYKSGLKNQQEEVATLFAKSIRLYGDGKFEEARKGFEEVAFSGVPLVSTGPTAKEYIAKIDDQLAKNAAVAAAPVAPAAPAVAAAVPVAAQTKPAAVEEELLNEKAPAVPLDEPKTTIAVAPPQEKQPATAPPVAAAPAAPAAVAVSAAKESSQCAISSDGAYVDKVMQQRNVQRSYTEAVVDDAAAKARAQMQQGNFAAARESIYSAWRVVDTNKILLGDDLYKKMNDTLTGIKNEIDAKDAAAAAITQQQRQKEAALLQNQLRGQQETERRQRIDDLMSKALALQREQRYEDARGQLELLLAIDPLNEQALTIHQTLTDMINFRKQLDVRRQIDEQTMATFLSADKSGIPHADELVYPQDWRELTSKRSPEEIGGMSADDVQVNKQLDESVDLSKLTPDTAFGDAIVMLQNSVQPQLRIFVNWKDLENNAEITRLTRINMEPISGIPLRKAIGLLLSSISGAGVKLGYAIEGGVVSIATEASLPTTMVQRAYDVSDLLGIRADFVTDLTTTGLGQISQAATTGGQGGGGGGGQRQQQQQQGQQQQMTSQELEQRSQTRIAQVEEMIKQINPESWDTAGGKGTLRVWDTSLIVVQTSEVHKQIADMIEKLRTAMGLGQQVAIEARFLLVSETFLEDIGFDVDFTSIHLGGKWDPLSVQQDSISTTSGAEKNTALTAQGAYGGVLDDLQVQFLVKATQESTNGRQLQAPRVCVLSGESATLSVTTDQSYISNVTAEQSTASAGTGTSTNVATTLQQEISTITSGVILNVTPTISSDKRYVILRITTNTTNVISLTPFTSTVATNGSTPIPATIYVPELQITQVQTRVSVPDKGTLLLGGQKITDESEVESGVPILGKLPIVGRLFNNRSEQRSQKVLLILVTPTIILQQEKEREAFPDLTAAKR